MALDPSKINVVRLAPGHVDGAAAAASSTQPHAPPPQQDDAQQRRAAVAAAATASQQAPCRVCCMMFGAGLTTCGAMLLNAVGVYMAMRARSAVHYNINGMGRQIGWLSMPSALAGATLHFFLYEAMSSPRRSGWGEAWVKAMVVNMMMWGGAIGTCTLLWRRGLRVCAAGRRLQARLPRSDTMLLERLVSDTRERLTGMDLSYWMWGTMTAHVPFVSCVTLCVYTDRAHLFMAPDGGYARRCLPLWRRKQFAAMARAPLVNTATTQAKT